MFPIESYFAEIEEFDTSGDGVKITWKPCKVIGITRDEDGDPAYLVEVMHKGVACLRVEGYVRPRP